MMTWHNPLVKKATDKVAALPPDDPLRRAVCETAADVLLETHNSRKQKKLRRLLRRTNRMAY